MKVTTVLALKLIHLQVKVEWGSAIFGSVPRILEVRFHLILPTEEGFC
jgi:hypothetical protein